MRHGQSLANIKKLIVSTPENGVTGYGLSEFGREQVKNSVLTNKPNGLTSNCHIICSDFKRALETAQIIASLLEASHAIQIDTRLRERNFGDFELTEDINYQQVWDADAKGSSHTNHNTESADTVMQRTSSLIISLEKEHKKEIFLLVAHGDTLQILQTAFKKQPASKQRELIHLENAEIRELTLRAQD